NRTSQAQERAGDEPAKGGSCDKPTATDWANKRPARLPPDEPGIAYSLSLPPRRGEEEVRKSLQLPASNTETHSQSSAGSPIKRCRQVSRSTSRMFSSVRALRMTMW